LLPLSLYLIRIYMKKKIEPSVSLKEMPLSDGKKSIKKSKSGKKHAGKHGGMIKEENVVSADETTEKKEKIKNKVYEKEINKYHIELVKLQEWIKNQGLKVVVIFEGRDAAGKGGVIKRITQPLNPRVCRIVALGTATEREKTQWYFQRYAAQLPAAGEMVLFDRSWYNRAGVERVMSFCTDDEYHEFMRSCPEFERMLIRSGIILIKYWFSVSDTEQEHRFQDRIAKPTKRWKLSPLDLESRKRWIEYSRAKIADSETRWNRKEIISPSPKECRTLARKSHAR